MSKKEAEKKMRSSEKSINQGYIDRMGQLIEVLGNNKRVSERFGFSTNTIHKWKTGDAAPSLPNISQLCKAAGYSLDWLVSGDKKNAEYGLNVIAQNTDILRLPEYDLSLSAGAGRLIENTEPIGSFSFDKKYFFETFRRNNTKGLIFCRVAGDSMSPTLRHSDLILLDTHNKNRIDGLLAYAYQDVARIKRVQFHMDYMVILSDNKQLHPEPERVSYEQAQTFGFDIIGKPIWSGGCLF